MVLESAACSADSCPWRGRHASSCAWHQCVHETQHGDLVQTCAWEVHRQQRILPAQVGKVGGGQLLLMADGSKQERGSWPRLQKADSSKQHLLSRERLS